METVIEQVTAIDDDDTVNAILVRREERACSSGFDAKAAAGREMKSVTDWEQQLKLQFDFIMQFWNSRKPTIALVHSYCLAGAFKFALACDKTIATKTTPSLRTV